MKPALLLVVITASASALGYLEIRHQAEREAWRAEVSRLGGRLDAAERLAEERAKTLADAKKDNRREKEAKAELAELEVQLLDAAAELARLESDRVVARGRADTALLDLQDQVRALTTIEMDVAALGKQRQRLQNEVEKSRRAPAPDRDRSRRASKTLGIARSRYCKPGGTQRNDDGEPRHGRKSHGG